MQSFLLRVGMHSAMRSHLSVTVDGKVLSACSRAFCSGTDQGAGFVPCSATNCSAGAFDLRRAKLLAVGIFESIKFSTNLSSVHSACRLPDRHF